MFYVSWILKNSFPGGFLVSISLLGTDLESLIKILTLNSHSNK